MRNIIIVALVAWLLFANGLSAIREATSNISLGNAPQVVVNGAQRAMATIQPPHPPAVPQVPGEVPATPKVLLVEAPAPTNAAAIVVPRGMPDLHPSTTPEPTAAYPSADLRYAVHTVSDKGYEQECVVVYSLNKRACLAPGETFTDTSAQWLAGMVEAGHVAGEPIPYGAPTATPIPPGVCAFSNAPYKAHREVIKNGTPLGSVNQASCISQADADQKADEAVEEMLSQ